MTCVASAVAAGAAAFLIGAPLAAAQPVPPCAPEDTQCQEQQDPGADIANQVVDNVQDGAEKVQDTNDALNPSNDSGGIGVMARVNGVLTCVKLGQPLPPGATFESPTGNGVSSYC